jgi:hypothetical protein
MWTKVLAPLCLFSAFGVSNYNSARKPSAVGALTSIMNHGASFFVKGLGVQDGGWKSGGKATAQNQEEVTFLAAGGRARTWRDSATEDSP